MIRIRYTNICSTREKHILIISIRTFSPYIMTKYLYAWLENNIVSCYYDTVYVCDFQIIIRIIIINYLKKIPHTHIHIYWD